MPADANGDAAPSGAGPHFLESEWVIWEHRAPDKNAKSYEDNMAKLCDVATVEDFWRAWNNIPAPSELFYDGRVRKKFATRYAAAAGASSGTQRHAAARSSSAQQ